MEVHSMTRRARSGAPQHASLVSSTMSERIQIQKTQKTQKGRKTPP
jgi:hypothetical protein